MGSDERGRATGVAALPDHARSPSLWVAGLTAAFVISLLLPAVTFFAVPTDYTVLHLVLEFGAMSVNLMVFALSWNLRRVEDNAQLAVIGLFSLAMLLIDLVHTLSYSGMPALVTPSGPEKAIFFWLAGRLVAVLGFLAVALVPRRHWSGRAWAWSFTAVGAVVVGVTWFGLWQLDRFPRTFVPGEGLTGFKVAIECALSTGYVLAAVLLARQAHRRRSIESAWLAAAAWTLALAELYFTLYASVTDVFNLLGHVFKVLAALMVYRAVFVAGVREPYRELAGETSLLRSLIDSVPDLISFKDRDGAYLGANAAFAAFSGVPEERLLGATDADLAGSAPTGLHLRVSDVDGGDDAVQRYEERITDAAGRTGVFDTLQTPYFGADGARLGIIEVRRDITRQKADERRIEHLALYDQLTGLPNRVLLADRVAEVIAAAASGGGRALIVLDLDDFRTVNDTIGHRVGDLILVETARRLRAVVPAGDLVARLGGDEYAVLVRDTSAVDPERLAQRLIDAVGEPFRVEQYELLLTTSVGVALHPRDGADFGALTQCADAAMYRAKRDGRSTYRFFTEDMQGQSALRLQLGSALRRAIDNDELRLHYQPQVSLADGHIVGVEALLRWEHPDLGLLQPGSFIELAEDSGLIIPIGYWVVEQALRDARSWEAAGLDPVTVAVNFSAVQFRQHDLPQRIAALLDAAGVSPERLDMEITESVAMANPEMAAATIERLHEIGVQVSIDDFGTGHSSLAYLKRFRVSRLKIDRSFVSDLGADPEDEAIVEAVIQVAQALNCSTLAEGVETQAQLDFLRSRGCETVQGYFFSPPVHPAQLLPMLRRASYALT